MSFIQKLFALRFIMISLFIVSISHAAVEPKYRTEYRVPLINLKLAYPQGYSLEFEVLNLDVLGNANVYLSLEPGTRALKANIGLRNRYTQSMMLDMRPYISYIHMNENNTAYKKGQDYAGLEGMFRIALLMLNGGVLIDVKTGKPQLTFAVGIGF